MRKKWECLERSLIDPCERECRLANEVEGNLDGYDCRICKNKGLIYTTKGGCLFSKDCSCMEIRSTIKKIRKSGLENVLQDYTFDKYIATEPWQKVVKEKALDFVENHDKQWFFIGGQVGAGKTHICTAIVNAFIQKGHAAQYMRWRDDSVKLKSVINDSEYERLMERFKTIPVLYIDDFFKTSVDKDGVRVPPTPADIALAFELLNYRYGNNKITIISSERNVNELIDCDEAVGSRIFQRTKGHVLIIPEDINKNYRLR